MVRHLLALVSLLALASACEEPAQSAPTAPAASAKRGGRRAPTATTGVEGAPSASPSASSRPTTAQSEDVWHPISKDGHDLGVVEVLAGKPWRVVLHSDNEDAKRLEALVNDHGAKPLAVSVHMPSEHAGQRGGHGSKLVPPGDKLYPFAVTERLERAGFDTEGSVARFEDKSPPTSVSKLELSRDGAKVGTLDLTAKPPKLDLVNREANALFLETFWQGLEREELLRVSYLPPEGGKDALVTVQAKKGTAEYPDVVRLAFLVRYPAFAVVVIP